MIRLLLPLILSLLFTPPPLIAGTLKQQQGPVTLELHFSGETQSLELADLLAVTLTVEGDEALRVRAPQQLAATEPWLLVERSEPERTRIGVGRVRWQLRYRFAPRAPGQKVPFALPEIVVREKGDEDQAIRFNPVAFDVLTSINLTDLGKLHDLRDITAIEELPEVPAAEFEWRWIALAFATTGLAASAFAIRWLLKRRQFRSSAQVALYEWQRLVALNLPEQNRSERFITLLTVLIRRYLERNFGMPARRQTTPEFLAEITKHPTLTSEEKTFLAEFLQSSESVKFGNQPMSLDECHRWSEAVKQFFQRRVAA